MEKRCRVCHQEKPITEFYKDSYSFDGKASLCKTCAKKASRLLDVVPVCHNCHLTAETDNEVEDLRTEGLPLFEMKDVNP